MRQSIVRHPVVVDQITLERGHIFVWAAVFEANFVITSGVVYERIDAAEVL